MLNTTLESLENACITIAGRVTGDTAVKHENSEADLALVQIPRGG